MYQRLLVPVDGSDPSKRGLDEALKIAIELGSHTRHCSAGRVSGVIVQEAAEWPSDPDRHRYPWSPGCGAPAQPTRSGPERQAWIDDVVQRRKGALVVPASRGEPRLQAHVADLYVWLSARADGTQVPGRPAKP